MITIKFRNHGLMRLTNQSDRKCMTSDRTNYNAGVRNRKSGQFAGWFDMNPMKPVKNSIRFRITIKYVTEELINYN